MTQDTVRAVVTRARGIKHGQSRFANGDIIQIPSGQFDDWNGLGWVEYAPAEPVGAKKSVPDTPEPPTPASDTKAGPKPA